MFRGEITRTPLVRKAKEGVGGRNTSAEDSVQCEFCDETSPSETALICHKLKHTENVLEANENGTICLTCIKEYQSAKELDKHIRSKHFLSSETAMRIEREIFICDKCENLFFNKAMLASHIAHVHNSKRPSVHMSSECPQCKETFSKAPIKPNCYHNLYNQFSVEACPICLRECKNRKEYLTHIENSHRKDYYCTICDFSTTLATTFTRHCQGHEQSFFMPKKRGKRSLKKYFVPSYRLDWKYINWSYVPQTGLCIQRPYVICVMCRAILLDDYEIKLFHVGSHGIKTNICEHNYKFVCKCGAKFEFEILLRQHEIKCESNENVKIINEQSIQEQKKFTCECGKEFIFPILLKKHQIECKTYQNLQVQQVTKPIGESVNTYTIASFKCESNENVKKINELSIQEQKKYTCQCGKEFIFPILLKKHQIECETYQNPQIQRVTKPIGESVNTYTIGSFKYNIIILPKTDGSKTQIKEITKQKTDTPTFVFASSTQVLDKNCNETQIVQGINEIDNNIVPFLRNMDHCDSKNIKKYKPNILTNTNRYEDHNIHDIIYRPTTYNSEDNNKEHISVSDCPDSQYDNIQDIIKIEEDFSSNTYVSENQSIKDIITTEDSSSDTVEMLEDNIEGRKNHLPFTYHSKSQDIIKKVVTDTEYSQAQSNASEIEQVTFLPDINILDIVKTEIEIED